MLISSVLATSAYAQQPAEDKQPDKQIERIGVTHKRTSIMSEITESAEKLTVMPGANGDPLQAAFALPGVVAAGGSSDSPAVRGSSPDDNLFEVDFMPAGYIFHDFGQSIFNKHLIQDFQLLSAGYGTSYSGATGAVFDVNLRTPKNQELQTTIDFSLFNTGIFLEGATGENSAFYLSYRKSMLPIFFGKGDNLGDDDSGITVNEPFDDNDYQGKWVWDMTDNDVLSVSVTGAQDMAAINLNARADITLRSPEYTGDADFDKKFDSQSIIWDHYAGDLQFKVGLGSLKNSEVLSLGKTAETPKGLYIDESDKQITYKSRLSYRFNPEHKLLLDAAYYDKTTTYDYDIYVEPCTEIDPDCGENKGERVNDVLSVDTSNYFVGISDLYTVNQFWQIEFGLQWQHHKYTNEDFVQPKLAVNYFITDESTIIAKYGLYNRQQDIDVIMPKIGNPDLTSQIAEHMTLGLEQNLDNDWSWSVEAYYKEMEDLPLALDELTSDKLYSNDVSGKAYGVDLLINKNLTDNWYGWLSLSYSKSERTNQLTNKDINYYADTPIVVNMVFNYQINQDWNAGFNFTGRSGQPYTPIVGVKENPDYQQRFLPVYGEAFSERFDLAHRLDVRVERKTTVWDLDAIWVFEIMNFYGQDNVAAIDLDYQEINSTDDLIIVEDTDGFEMRPSVGFSITF